MISMKETMLQPRKRPKSPPREEMNSTGPIEMPLSSSFRKERSIEYASPIYYTYLTHDTLLSKEDVESSKVFLPSIVCGWSSLRGLNICFPCFQLFTSVGNLIKVSKCLVLLALAMFSM